MWGWPTAPTQWDPLPLEYCRVRKLTPNLEHVTWREPTVTPSDLAISSREIPSATQSLIFWMLAGVNFVAIRPLGPANACNVIVNPYDGSGPEFVGDEFWLSRGRPVCSKQDTQVVCRRHRASEVIIEEAA